MNAKAPQTPISEAAAEAAVTLKTLTLTNLYHERLGVELFPLSTPPPF